MKYRIALASSDGFYVDRHFGKADWFEIYDVDGDGFTQVESRRNVPSCQGGHHDAHSFDFALQDPLRDVSAVFAVRVGEGAAAALLAACITVYEVSAPVDKLMEKIVRDKLWEAGMWQSRMKN